MGTAFTPGPWVAWQAPTGEAVVKRVYRDDQNRRVTEWPAVCNCNTLDNMANAHLIAAAPELYEALDEYLEANKTYDFRAVRIAETKAIAALAKARSEQ